MKIYWLQIPHIASEIVGLLTKEKMIDVAAVNREEAEKDLIAVMEEYLRRDMTLREKVRDYMSREKLSYDQYGKARGRIAKQMKHPSGDDVERFLARQFVESFMMSRFVDEVYADDPLLYRTTIEKLRALRVDEGGLREEASGRIQNLTEGTMDYEVAFSKALREVKRKHGLIR